MLKKLHIQNYAIIDEIEIDFSNQLNIITGETGAGKSILMGALSLILGERADTSALLKPDKKCFIEGIFSIDDKKEIQSFFKENDLDETDELVLRREITSNGKSRAFINDTPSTLQQLKQLASLLVDLHQQFDTLELGDSDFQREVMDALANNQSNIESYQILYQQLLQAKKALSDLQVQKINFNKEADYNQFLFDELIELNLHENELEELENELKLLNNSEGIKTTLSNVYFNLRESEQPVVQLLKQLSNELQVYASLNDNIANIIQRLQSSQIELLDIAEEVDSINDSVNYDANRIQTINEKISNGYRLLKKHGVKTTNELLSIQQSLQEKLQAVLNIDEAILTKEKEVKSLQVEAINLSEKISKSRNKQAKPLEEKVNALLIQVGMPNAKLKVEIKETTLN